MKEAVERAEAMVRKEVVKAVEEITGEMEAVRDDDTQIDDVKDEAAEIGQKIKDVGDEVHQIKKGIEKQSRKRYAAFCRKTECRAPISRSKPGNTKLRLNERSHHGQISRRRNVFDVAI